MGFMGILWKEPLCDFAKSSQYFPLGGTEQ